MNSMVDAYCTAWHFWVVCMVHHSLLKYKNRQLYLAFLISIILFLKSVKVQPSLTWIVNIFVLWRLFYSYALCISKLSSFECWKILLRKLCNATWSVGFMHGHTKYLKMFKELKPHLKTKRWLNWCTNKLFQRSCTYEMKYIYIESNYWFTEWVVFVIADGVDVLKQ
jgi:hypothetical protein